ncbi:MAG: hypothetical protein NVSMB5_18110 [Candidatus Velthaea sp.]
MSIVNAFQTPAGVGKNIAGMWPKREKSAHAKISVDVTPSGSAMLAPRGTGSPIVQNRLGAKARRLRIRAGIGAARAAYSRIITTS